jgi:hypothetical protein
MLEPEFLSTLEADVHLVADLIALRAAIPGKTLETARQVVRKVVDDLRRRLEHDTRETLRGALNRSQRTRRPRHPDIDWPRTIQANLRHYQPQHRTKFPRLWWATPATPSLSLSSIMYPSASISLARCPFRRVFFDFCARHGIDPRPFNQARLLRYVDRGPNRSAR